MLQETFLLYFSIGSGLIQMIRMEKSICYIWVTTYWPALSGPCIGSNCSFRHQTGKKIWDYPAASVLSSVQTLAHFWQQSWPACR